MSRIPEVFSSIRGRHGLNRLPEFHGGRYLKKDLPRGDFRGRQNLRINKIILIFITVNLNFRCYRTRIIKIQNNGINGINVIEYYF
jgi:hypothetical protein